MAEYSEMSYEELVEANQALMEKRGEVMAEIENEQLELHKHLDRRITEQALKGRFGDMPQEEKDLLAELLAQEVVPEGSDN